MVETMTQAYLPEPGTILYRQVERPTAAPGEVVIAVKRIGICGSDVHVFRGKHPLVSFPLVQGHEFSGLIHETGAGVEGFRKGDLVTVMPALGCGACDRCRSGLFAQCEGLRFIGGALPGAGSNYFAVEARYAVKMPAGVTEDDAAMVEPLAVAVHSVRKVPDLGGRPILVAGAGTVGQCIAQVARRHGAGTVVVADREPFRLAIARSMGFETLLADSPEAIEKRVTGLMEGRNPWAAFECVGAGVVLNGCIRAVERGGRIVVVGVYEEPPVTEMVLVQDKEILLAGSLMYTWEDYGAAVALLSDGDVDLAPLRTHHVPFEQWAEGYKILIEKTGESLKVLVDL
ncbi:MAG: alcohol dehydrogenase catalytic domain-containing protein [Spirochaetes bacterium]|nr:alcohol dehydrogenase catalytic domain-containing protein [Spirochaetota bacterium]